jgi:Phage integrase, N-terminal SAM-like domain
MDRKNNPPGDTSSSSPPRLLDQVRNAIRHRHYGYRTEQSYIHWMKRFIHFHGVRHPRELGEPEVTAFLNSLVAGRGVAAATQNQALSALLFLYKKCWEDRSTGWTA